jgi:hypothetical protein
MELLGEANWYLPRWLDKILPRFSIEGEEHPRAAHPALPADLEPEPAYAGVPERNYRTVEARPEPPLPRHHAYPAPPPAAAAPAAPADRAPSPLDHLLRDLPFKAGIGDVRTNLEEVAEAAYDYFASAEAAGGPGLDVSRVSGYLLLEQRLGRIGKSAHPEHAAQLLIGAVAARALTSNGDSSPDGDYPKNAVRMVLEGIGKPG